MIYEPIIGVVFTNLTWTQTGHHLKLALLGHGSSDLGVIVQEYHAMPSKYIPLDWVKGT